MELVPPVSNGMWPSRSCPAPYSRYPLGYIGFKGNEDEEMRKGVSDVIGSLGSNGNDRNSGEVEFTEVDTTLPTIISQQVHQLQL